MSNGYNITCDLLVLWGCKLVMSMLILRQVAQQEVRCTTTKQEIIGYTQAGQPISKGQSSSSWMDFVPQLTVLNQDGQAYQPYGGAGIPYSLQGGSLVKWNPTDMQALAYLDSAPAQARDAYQERVCNPLWSGVFGCREGNEAQTDQEIQSQNDDSTTKKRNYVVKLGKSGNWCSNAWRAILWIYENEGD